MSRKTRNIVIAGAALLLVAAGLILWLTLGCHSPNADIKRMTSDSVVFLFGSQNDKPIRGERLNSDGIYEVSVEYSYDADGCLKQSVSYNWTDKGLNKTVLNFHYDESGVLDFYEKGFKLDTEDNSSCLFRCEYDENYRLKTVRSYTRNDKLVSTSEYIYQNGRLTEVKSSSETTITENRYTYNSEGRLETFRYKTVSTAYGNELTSGISKYVYDDEGRLSGILDENGRMTTRYIYDD